MIMLDLCNHRSGGYTGWEENNMANLLRLFLLLGEDCWQISGRGTFLYIYCESRFGHVPRISQLGKHLAYSVQVQLVGAAP